MVVITDEAYHRMIELSRQAHPAEACGILLRSDGCADAIDIVRPVRNIHPHPERAFAFDPADWVAAWTEMRRDRLKIAGFWHSHPHGPPVPSAADREGWLTLGGPEYIHWIISLEEGPCGEVRTAVYRPSGRGCGGRPVPVEASVRIVRRDAPRCRDRSAR